MFLALYRRGLEIEKYKLTEQQQYEKSVRFGNVCRICLDENENHKNLTDTPPDSVSYLDKLTTCVPSLGTDNDLNERPNKICNKCSVALDRSYEFYLLCIESEQRIRNDVEFEIDDDAQQDEVQQDEVQQDDVELTEVISGKTYRENYLARHKEIRKHIESLHTDKVHRKRTCPVCGESFKQTSLFVTHMRGHDMDYDQPTSTICDICGKTFHYNYIRYHLKTHLKIKPSEFMCDLCPFKTSKSNVFKKHFFTHSNDYPFACKKCSQRFHSKSGCKWHMRSKHSKLGPTISCNFCDEKFFTVGTLKRHVVCHYRTTQYKCSECRKVYATYKGMLSHMKRHHTGCKRPSKKMAIIKSNLIK